MKKKRMVSIPSIVSPEANKSTAAEPNCSAISPAARKPTRRAGTLTAIANAPWIELRKPSPAMRFR